MAFSFPTSPADGDKYPDPAVNGKAQFQWDGALGVWQAVSNSVKTNNPDAFNEYTWPEGPIPDGNQLTTDSDGVLSWSSAAVPVIKPLALLEPFDDTTTEFTIVEAGTLTPLAPTPSENLVVFLGGVPQIDNAAYTVSGSEISFTEAPASGTVFSAFTIVNEPAG
jgi:hypothetical protein